MQRALSIWKESKHGLSGWHSVSTTEKYFPPAALVYGVPKRREAEQISASISVRWEPDRIFAYHNVKLLNDRAYRLDWAERVGTGFVLPVGQLGLLHLVRKTA